MIMASGTTDLYERLRGPKRLSMSPGGHGWLFLPPAFQQQRIQWMNRGVKALRNGIGARPPVTIYWEPRPGLPPAGGWATQRTRLRRFWLTSARTLSAAPPGNSPADERGLRDTYPTGVELTGSNTEFAVPPDPNGSLTWTSAPFHGDFTILGSVQLRFYAASQNPDTDFEFVLQDVYPNGDVRFLQRGILRASLRSIARSRSAPDHLVHAYRRAAYLIPGRIYESRLSLPPLGAVLRRGQRLQLALLAPSPIPQPSWGLVPVDVPGQNTVHASVRYPCAIIVPMMADARAKRAPPPCGSMPLQPCRKPAHHR